MNPNVGNMAQEAYNQSRQLQNMYNTQSQQAQGQYNTAFGSAQQSQQELRDFAKNMGNYGEAYQNHLAQAQSQYGFNPADLLKANLNLARTNTTMANLPTAVNQMGGGYGATAGQQAANYSNLSSNLAPVLQGQTNQVGAYRDLLAATQQQANQQTTQELTGHQQQLSAYQSAAQNATTILGQAGQTMNNIEQLQQQQGYLTAQQQQAYATAQASYAQARNLIAQIGVYGAQIANYGAQTNLLGAQTAAQQQQNQQNSIQAQRNNNVYNLQTSGTTGPILSNPQFSSSGRTNLSPVPQLGGAVRK